MAALPRIGQASGDGVRETEDGQISAGRVDGKIFFSYILIRDMWHNNDGESNHNLTLALTDGMKSHIKNGLVP